jgi:AcrR family transcriptional regulator
MSHDVDDKRPHEDDYFRRKDQELIEALRQSAAQKAQRQKLAQEAGLAEDDPVLKDLEALGWSGDTLKLLHIFPLVEVAWADGKVEPPERALILEAARAQGIVSGSAYDRLLDSLKERPSPERFARAWRILKALMDALPADQKTAGTRTLVTLAGDIAKAAGGFFGFGTKVSPEESRTLARIAGELEKAHGAAAKAVVEKSGG